MASVFYLLVMFILYAIMVSNNNLHCQAATSLDFNCIGALLQINDEIAYQSSRGNYVWGPNGTVTLSPERCGSVPNTKLSGRDLVLCKCKAQEVFGTQAGIIGKDDPVTKVLNLLNSDKELAKSCGFEDIDCNTAFQSVLTPCEAEARDAMETCAPMVKAAAEGDVGNRGRQRCCSELNTGLETLSGELEQPLFGRTKTCTCSSYRVKNQSDSTKFVRINEFLEFVNNTLREECGLSENSYNGPVCELSQNNNQNRILETSELCFVRDFRNLKSCGPILKKPRTEQASDLPLIDPIMGCCLNQDMCKCDPRSESCCQKLGKLSKNEKKSCMCELLNSSKTLPSTLKFLNFVRYDTNQKNSCSKISPVYIGTCVPSPASAYQPKLVDFRELGLEANPTRGFRTFNNPNP